MPMARWKSGSAARRKGLVRSSSAIVVGTVKRPDGEQQVTFRGRPLYTFTEEGPGQLTGDGFKDSFGGTSFTWRAVFAPGGAPPASSTTTAPAGSSGYGY